jgi:hypothetical protein
VEVEPGRGVCLPSPEGPTTLILIVCTLVFFVAGVWISAHGVVVRANPRRRPLPPTRHERRVTLIDAQG